MAAALRRELCGMKADSDEAEPARDADTFEQIQVLSNLGAGLVDGLQGRAGELQLPAWLQSQS